MSDERRDGAAESWLERNLVPAMVIGLGLVGLGAWAIMRNDAAPARIVAPRPPVVADQREAYDMAPSLLSVPVRISIRTLLDEVESAVPTEWGSPEAVLTDSTAQLSTTVEYSLEATYDLPLLPDLNLGCGTGDGPKPRLAVSISSPIALAQDWSLVTEARVDRVSAASSEERDRCEVTFAGFDVTGRMEEAARTFLQDHTSTIDSIVAAADLRASFVSWWDVLREPIELDDNVWLEIRPVEIERGLIRGSGDVVEVDANLRARPRVLLGDRPPIWETELPSLGQGSGDGELDILIEAEAEYPTASRRLNEELGGVEVEGAGQRIELVSVEIYGIGGGQIAVGVTVRGDLEGELFLVGTPSYDTEASQVYVPDLEFSVETNNLLVSGASRALNRRLEAVLRERARWSVDEVVTWAADRLREGLNRDLADGVTLSGSVGEVEIIRVDALTQGLLVSASGSAQATLTVDR
jgi:hypothetical protein